MLHKTTHFRHSENENFLRQHCSPFQDTCLYIIWTYFNKLCHECHHNILYLAWKSWIFVHGSSFLRTRFQDICCIPSFLFSIETRSHIMTRCEGFPLFWFFFWILYADFKMRSKLTTRPLLVRGWILRNYWGISDEIDSCAPKNDFFQKITSKLRGSCSSNLTRFQPNRQKIVFLMRRVRQPLTHKFVFLMRRIWKTLTHKYFVICTSNMVYYFIKFVWSNLKTYFW